MSKNIQDVINAYSTGAVYENWGSKKGGLRDCEAALMQAHCPDRDAVILTVGCGAGRETFTLYKLGFRNVRGIDCTDALLQVAMNRNKEEGLSIEFKLAMADNLPYPSNTFDVITIFENVYGFITPHSARIASLTEVKRVLKPGGLVMLTVNSIFNCWRYFAFIKMTEILRIFYNPHEMEKGDKFWGEERRASSEGIARTKTHWFRPDEITEEACSAGLSVLQVTTNVGVCKNPKINSAKLHGQGGLVYVLQRPR